MKLTDTELEVRDREWVESVLQPDEELLLVCKPQVRLWRGEYRPVAVFAVFWLAIVGTISTLVMGGVARQVHEEPLLWLYPLFLLPFWCIGIGMLTSPWRLRALDRRTVYLLTDKRAVVLRPSDFRFRPTQKDYELTHDLIKEVQQKNEGGGSLVFEFEERHSKSGVHYVPKGFLHVPQVQRVAEVVRAQLPAPESMQEAGATETEPQEVEFPSLGTLIVGCIFIFIGGGQALTALQHELNAEKFYWVGAIIAIAWPMAFACVGGFAVRQWCRDFIQYRRSKKRCKTSVTRS